MTFSQMKMNVMCDGNIIQLSGQTRWKRLNNRMELSDETEKNNGHKRMELSDETEKNN